MYSNTVDPYFTPQDCTQKHDNYAAEIGSERIHNTFCLFCYYWTYGCTAKEGNAYVSLFMAPRDVRVGCFCNGVITWTVPFDFINSFCWCWVVLSTGIIIAIVCCCNTDKVTTYPWLYKSQWTNSCLVQLRMSDKQKLPYGW